MVALAIIAIIAAVAMPLYTQYSNRTYRSEAQADLLNCSQALERLASVNFSYRNAADTDADGVGDADAGVIATTLCDPRSVRSGRYAITVNANDTTFTLTATPQNGTDEDRLLSLNSAGVRGWDEDGANGIEADEQDWEEG
jgi:type IV pilus assembly protein PilE